MVKFRRRKLDKFNAKSGILVSPIIRLGMFIFFLAGSVYFSDGKCSGFCGKSGSFGQNLPVLPVFRLWSGCGACVTVLPVRKCTFPGKKADFGRYFSGVPWNICDFFAKIVCVLVGFYLCGACATCVLPVIRQRSLCYLCHLCEKGISRPGRRILEDFSPKFCVEFVHIFAEIACVFVGFYLRGACSTCVLPVLRLWSLCGLRRNPFSRKSCDVSVGKEKSTCAGNKSTGGSKMRRPVNINAP